MTGDFAWRLGAEPGIGERFSDEEEYA